MRRRYTSQKKARNVDELGMEVVVGRGSWRTPSRAGGEGRATLHGAGQGQNKDNSRGGHRWRKKALLSLKRGLYSILFAG